MATLALWKWMILRVDTIYWTTASIVLKSLFQKKLISTFYFVMEFGQWLFWRMLRVRQLPNRWAADSSHLMLCPKVEEGFVQKKEDLPTHLNPGHHQRLPRLPYSLLGALSTLLLPLSSQQVNFRAFLRSTSKQISISELACSRCYKWYGTETNKQMEIL